MTSQRAPLSLSEKVGSQCRPENRYKLLIHAALLLFPGLLAGVMGEYEPKIEVHFPTSVLAARGVTVRLECFALGK